MGRIGLVSNHPGEIFLDQFILPQRESMAQLARALDEPISRIQELVSGCGRITEAMAMKLAHHYGAPANYWLNLQVRFKHRAASYQASTTQPTAWPQADGLPRQPVF